MLSAHFYSKHTHIHTHAGLKYALVRFYTIFSVLHPEGKLRVITKWALKLWVCVFVHLTDISDTVAVRKLIGDVLYRNVAKDDTE